MPQIIAFRGYWAACRILAEAEDCGFQPVEPSVGSTAIGGVDVLVDASEVSGGSGGEFNAKFHGPPVARLKRLARCECGRGLGHRDLGESPLRRLLRPRDRGGADKPPHPARRPRPCL